MIYCPEREGEGAPRLATANLKIVSWRWPREATSPLALWTYGDPFLACLREFVFLILLALSPSSPLFFTCAPCLKTEHELEFCSTVVRRRKEGKKKRENDMMRLSWAAFTGNFLRSTTNLWLPDKSLCSGLQESERSLGPARVFGKHEIFWKRTLLDGALHN
jgi:hypothetical protein